MILIAQKLNEIIGVMDISLSSDLLIDIMLTFGLQHVASVCTRGGNTILDLLFLSKVFSEGTVEIEIGISDHKLISFASTMGVNVQ